MTDHRTEAVTDLDAAFSHMLDIGPDDPDAKWRMIGSALIGIGHALLAQQQPVNVVKISGNPTEAEVEHIRAQLRGAT